MLSAGQILLSEQRGYCQPSLERLRLVVRGAVQGVGFRPFIYRLATDLKLVGWISNSSTGVMIEVEGLRHDLETFLLRIDREKPPRSFIQSLESSFLDPIGYTDFEIRPSLVGENTVLVLPDVATCSDCLREILDSGNRRYLYPFTNCTNCGPRFSIIESLPYDRLNTAMKMFTMCETCRSEYENPSDRRFHAQPNACPACGPHLELWDSEGEILGSHHEALLETVEAIRAGKIVAVKGLGGFHLVVDATNEKSVNRLRERKHREEKPFALMYPNLERVKEDCEVSPMEERVLHSPEAPIVLLHRRRSWQRFAIVNAVAPGNPYLGVLLPYTPLHHLLMEELELPIVATSGNLSEEPIATDEQEALVRLKGIADLFLVHDRPITRHVDDSIVRVLADRELVIRRARGLAPLPIPISSKEKISSVLGVGAHLKNTIAQSISGQIFVSQHIGDLENEETFRAFARTIKTFHQLYDCKPEVIACDLHPDYLSTQFAENSSVPIVPVQHHYAHVLACMVENELEAPALGVAWDGTGCGEDGTVWGGEFLLVDQESYLRAAHFRTFPLPGGEKAIREPRRSALGLLYEIFGDRVFEMSGLVPLQAFSFQELNLLRDVLKKEIQSPRSSSVGRLFDAVASILGIRQIHRFEGQAAMELEFLLEGVGVDEAYPLAINSFQDSNSKTQLVVNWEQMIFGILDDLHDGIPDWIISAKFHNALVKVILEVALKLNQKNIVLSGGCFQNKYLLERSIYRLREEGFRPYWHQRIPPNDGGIAVGQVAAAIRFSNKR